MNFDQKKAQTEMIGLVVIVVLVITGLMVFMVYRINQPQDNARDRYVDKQVATNMLVAMTNTQVRECHNHTLGELIIDCARFSPNYKCYDMNSCEAANQTLSSILDRTLGEWQMSYNLTIEREDIDELVLGYDSYGCGPEKESESGFQILTIDASNNAQLQMMLRICKD